jgi:hypothetical protein
MKILIVLLGLASTAAAFLVPLVSSAHTVQQKSANPIISSQAHPHCATVLAMGSGNVEDGNNTDFDTLTVLSKALNGNVDESTILLDRISDLRQKNDMYGLNVLLDEILTIIDNPKRPIWSKFRALTRFSKRSRFASLRRVLDMSTPAADSEDDDTDEAKQKRRKRALIIALRSLISDSGDEKREQNKVGVPIRMIEKAAIKDQKDASSMGDMDSRLPAGLETPKYDVIIKRTKYEIRNYKAFSVCSVPMLKARPDAEKTDQRVSNPQLSGASSFGALAGYLFGKNEAQVSMKMTTPVLTTGDGEEKEMAFVMPSSYWEEEGLSNAPSPLKDSLVKLKRDLGGNRAVLMFGGFASSKDVDARKSMLLRELEKDKEWKIVDGSTCTLAQYNDPFTPPWKRRNEVSIPVIKRD